MCRTIARARLHVVHVAAALCLALSVQPLAHADEVTGLDDAKSYPNAANRTFEDERDGAGFAYLSCLSNAFLDDVDRTVADAQWLCADAAKRYAQYLPADAADQLMLLAAYRVQAKTRP